MNLLLLFSALLSAITGVNAGGRPVPVPAEQVARVGDAIAVRAMTTVAVQRPVQSVASIVSMLAVAAMPRITVVALPLYASRRRE